MSLPDGLDWLMRPVLKGMCKFESLKDVTLDIADIAMMNDAIDVERENEMVMADLFESLGCYLI